eukprot:CCRYP_017560-RA/>CCRYP_017560-RA protein AED:0.35 eAED:0.35 QI:0/0/0/1/1/1/2/0/336
MTVAATTPTSASAVMDSGRSFNGETSDSSLSGSESVNATPSLAIQPIVTVCKSSSGTKRPQMKYDPEVPLSKEETSAWRREQRRKRNRESAAACRKRQRDRISELEIEVSGWKAKFDEAVRKLREIEGEESAEMELQAIETLFPERISCATPSSSDSEDGENQEHLVSPCVSFNIQEQSCVVTPPCNSHAQFIPSIVTSAGYPDFPLFPETNSVKTERLAFINADSFDTRVEKGQHLSEMITRPAASRLLLFRRRSLVKITGAVPTPLTSIESACDELLELVPDSILSMTEVSSMPFPQTCSSLVPPVVSDIQASQVSEGDASELDEFLLDAVQWL